MTPCCEPTSEREPASGYCDTVRRKFREVFGRDCTLPNDLLTRHYSVTSTGDLIMILR